MEQNIIIQKRNNVFIGTFIIFIIIHLLSSILFVQNGIGPSQYYEVIYIVFLILLFFWNPHSLSTQYTLFVLLNLYSFFININCPSIMFLVFLIYPVFVSSLYHNVLQRTVLLFITIMEVMLLVFFHQASYSYFVTVTDILLLLLFLGMVVKTSISTTISETKHWNNLSEQNNSMRKELDSRAGYLHLFFDQAKDSIAVFDLDNTIIEVNHAFEEMYGWSREEVIGKSIQLVPPENQAAADIRHREVLKGISYHSLETQDMKKDGTYFDVQITLSPIYDHDCKLVALSAISRDISYKKEAEKLLVQSEKLKLAGEIAAGVAHEVRNPMTVVSGFIQMMNKDKDHPYYEYTKLIQSEIERINYIMSEFLVLAKPHAIVQKKYNFIHTLEDIIMLFQAELNLNGIILTKQILIKNPFLFGEENLMKQMLINIFKNAIEATTENGHIDISLVEQQAGIMTLKIKDNGIGMDATTLERLFDPFFTTKERGTGLGMMISKKIITEYGGHIFLESEKEKGTTVTIELPHQASEEG